MRQVQPEESEVFRLPGEEIQAGEPLELNGLRLIPFIRTARLKAPGNFFHFFWSRPASILTISADGSEQVIPVPDMTRRIQWFILGAGIVGAFLIRFVGRRRSDSARAEVIQEKD